MYNIYQSCSYMLLYTYINMRIMYNYSMMYEYKDIHMIYVYIQAAYMYCIYM